MQQVREWLVGIRKEKALTQLEVSSSAKISKQMYSAIETGERHPSVPTAKRIAEVLDFDWTRFFKEE